MFSNGSRFVALPGSRFVPIIGARFGNEPKHDTHFEGSNTGRVYARVSWQKPRLDVVRRLR